MLSNLFLQRTEESFMKYFGLLANPRRCLAGRIRGHRMRETRENWGLGTEPVDMPWIADTARVPCVPKIYCDLTSENWRTRSKNSLRQIQNRFSGARTRTRHLVCRFPSTHAFCKCPTPVMADKTKQRSHITRFKSENPAGNLNSKCETRLGF